MATVAVVWAAAAERAVVVVAARARAVVVVWDPVVEEGEATAGRVSAMRGRVGGRPEGCGVEV